MKENFCHKQPVEWARARARANGKTRSIIELGCQLKLKEKLRYHGQKMMEKLQEQEEQLLQDDHNTNNNGI